MLVFWIELVKAFCAAENTDPKKPGDECKGVGVSLSRVGVNGDEAIVANLLGTRLADPDLPRL